MFLQQVIEYNLALKSEQSSIANAVKTVATSLSYKLVYTSSRNPILPGPFFVHCGINSVRS
jgi:hypothetical protein